MAFKDRLKTVFSGVQCQLWRRLKRCFLETMQGLPHGVKLHFLRHFLTRRVRKLAIFGWNGLLPQPLQFEKVSGRGGRERDWVVCVRERRRERAATEREDPFEREEREREREFECEWVWEREIESEREERERRPWGSGCLRDGRHGKYKRYILNAQRRPLQPLS